MKYTVYNMYQKKQKKRNQIVKVDTEIQIKE